MRYRLAAVSFAIGLVVNFPDRVDAAFFKNTTGLANPAVVIRFDEIVLPPDTPIDTQYAELGVYFSPSFYYSPLPIPPFGPFPNVDANHLGNFQTVNFLNTVPLSIRFTVPQTEAAIALIPGASFGNEIFLALLDGVVVEMALANTTFPFPATFYGFTGITFDEIRPLGGTTRLAIIDNIQLGTPPPRPIPEPSTLTLLLIAVAAAGFGAKLYRLRRSTTLVRSSLVQLYSLCRICCLSSLPKR